MSFVDALLLSLIVGALMGTVWGMYLYLTAERK